MKKTTKKSAKEKHVLIAALLVAAVTITGSTFAWFTSKDEVTNRLTASADYGVSIVEDFKFSIWSAARVRQICICALTFPL